MTIELYKNSFVTLEDAQIYFEERYDSNEWFELDDKEKEQLLVQASKKTNALDFVGKKLDKSQPMEFPRNFDLPQDIKNAVCEEAIAIIKNKNNSHLDNINNNISSISLGAGSVSYQKNSQNNEENLFVSKTAFHLTKKWTKKGYNSPF